MNTNFWEDMDMNHEMAQIRTIQSAAKKAGLKHVVLSTLPDTREFVNKAENKDSWKVLQESDGFNSYVPHFDGKGSLQKEFAADVPTTLYQVTFYYENFIYFGMGPTQHAPDTPYAVTFPMGDAKLAMISVRDIGKQVLGIFKDPKTINTTVSCSSDNLTCKEIADTFTKVCGYQVVYNAVPVDVYAGFGFPGAEDLANMFRYWTTFIPPHLNIDSTAAMLVGASVSVSAGVEEQIKQGQTVSLEKWIEANKDAFPL